MVILFAAGIWSDVALVSVLEKLLGAEALLRWAPSFLLSLPQDLCHKGDQGFRIGNASAGNTNLESRPVLSPSLV